MPCHTRTTGTVYSILVKVRKTKSNRVGNNLLCLVARNHVTRPLPTPFLSGCAPVARKDFHFPIGARL